MLRLKLGSPDGRSGPQSRIASVAIRWAWQIGFDQLFDGEEGPFPRMSEMIEMKKERNFFEPRGSECQSGGCLKWE